MSVRLKMLSFVAVLAYTSVVSAGTYARYAGVASGGAGVTVPDLDTGKTRYVAAGAYKIYVQSADSTPVNDIGATQFIGFCVDTRDWAQTSYTPYEHVALKDVPDGHPMQQPKATAIGKLLTLAFGKSSGAITQAMFATTNAAAIQLAIWEIVNESLTSYDVRYGTWTATNISNATLDQANTWLAGISPATVPYLPLSAFRSDGVQDYMLAVPFNGPPVAAVPEPLTMTAAFLAVAGLGTYIRRRTSSPLKKGS